MRCRTPWGRACTLARTARLAGAAARRAIVRLSRGPACMRSVPFMSARSRSARGSGRPAPGDGATGAVPIRSSMPHRAGPGGGRPPAPGSSRKGVRYRPCRVGRPAAQGAPGADGADTGRRLHVGVWEPRSARARWQRGSTTFGGRVGLAGVLLTFAVLASLQALTIYPFHPPDEMSHVGYALEISRGDLPTIETPIPGGEIPLLQHQLNNRRPANRTIWTANHPPLYYLRRGRAAAARRGARPPAGRDPGRPAGHRRDQPGRAGAGGAAGPGAGAGPTGAVGRGRRAGGARAGAGADLRAGLQRRADVHPDHRRAAADRPGAAPGGRRRGGVALLAAARRRGRAHPGHRADRGRGRRGRRARRGAAARPPAGAGRVLLAAAAGGAVAVTAAAAAGWFYLRNRRAVRQRHRDRGAAGRSSPAPPGARSRRP